MLVLGLICVCRFNLERLGIHVPPVGVLEVSGAVQKKGRERWTKLLEVVKEQVALELVENGRALPSPLAGATFAPQLSGNRLDRAQ